MRISVRIGAKVVRIMTNQIIKLETLKKADDDQNFR